MVNLTAACPQDLNQLESCKLGPISLFAIQDNQLCLTLDWILDNWKSDSCPNLIISKSRALTSYMCPSYCETELLGTNILWLKLLDIWSSYIIFYYWLMYLPLRQLRKHTLLFTSHQSITSRGHTCVFNECNVGHVAIKSLIQMMGEITWAIIPCVCFISHENNAVDPLDRPYLTRQVINIICSRETCFLSIDISKTFVNTNTPIPITQTFWRNTI